MVTKAWMIRNDGNAIACNHHLYVMYDEDLSSEAEVAAFIINTKSADSEYAEYVVNCWLALLLEQVLPYDYTEEDIDKLIQQEVQALPYHFQFGLSVAKLCDIRRKQDAYHNIDEFYEFVDDVKANRASISDSMARILNQQFCRARYGGQYDTASGNAGIWFRISSVGFNWADIIYVFISEHRRSLGIQSVYICRDYESDNGEETGKPEYFYKAKDGAVYFNMPVDEFLNEEHEHSLVFSSVNICRGVIASVYDMFARGYSYGQVCHELYESDIKLSRIPWDYFVRKDSKECIDCSDFIESLNPRTQSKLSLLEKRVMDMFPEIEEVDLTFEPAPNTKGRMVGIQYNFDLKFADPKKKGILIDIPFTKGDATADTIFRRFNKEYSDWKKFTNA